MTVLKNIFLFGMMALAVISISSTVMAMGRTCLGEECWNVCSGDSYVLQYLPPHYSGKIYVFWDSGNVFISGFVKQSSECYGHIPPAKPYMISGGVSLEEFQGLTADDIKGLCLTDLPNNGSFNCIDQGLIKVVNAYNLRRTSATSFTVNVVLAHTIVIGEK